MTEPASKRQPERLRSASLWPAAQPFSVSIGLSLAFNEISSETDATISSSADVTTRSGNVSVTALSHGTPLFNFVFNSGGTTAACAHG